MNDGLHSTNHGLLSMNYGPLSMNYGPLECLVASCFGLLGFPGSLLLDFLRMGWYNVGLALIG